MTPFTLVMSYYLNPSMLKEQLWKWWKLPRDIQENLNVVIVDDGSPTSPAHEVLLSSNPEVPIHLASIQVWRMGVDVRWNTDACRNVGVREAPTKWVLLTDMDHVVPPDTWRKLMTEKLRKNLVYRFGRVNAPALEPYKAHPNSWALTTGMYWKIGGYDEALAGNYGTDGDFLVRARRTAEVVELPADLIRYPRDVIPDASTTTLERKSPEDKKNINRLIHARNDEGRAPLHFTFPCERVL